MNYTPYDQFALESCPTCGAPLTEEMGDFCSTGCRDSYNQMIRREDEDLALATILEEKAIQNDLEKSGFKNLAEYLTSLRITGN